MTTAINLIQNHPMSPHQAGTFGQGYASWKSFRSDLPPRWLWQAVGRLLQKVRLEDVLVMDCYPLQADPVFNPPSIGRYSTRQGSLIRL